MIRAITTIRQLGQFLEEQKPEILVEGAYASWMLRDCQDIIVCWEYGKIKSCCLYYPTSSEHFEELIEMSKSWNTDFHREWGEIKELAKFRIFQTKQALDCHQELAQAG
ncbi:Uncharacterized protein dnl_51400 [Desulfonema limicola]|uniref:Uncharacterized protein n=1 Tax=Desulfonema limicola TaxID=45656 RepID=A0A975BCI4_9BACT|nr:hypothetical protein [Desulfonema limicola]QTA82758.1 Uncharacterized protein dnl_51400 [Desulfonema limicola]